MRRTGIVFLTAFVLVLVASAPSGAAQQNKASGEAISTLLPYPEAVDLSITFSAKWTPDGFGKATFTWYERVQGQAMTGPYTWTYVTGLTFRAWEPGKPNLGGSAIFYVAYQPGTLLANYVQALSAAKYAEWGSTYCPEGDPGFTYGPGDWVKIIAVDQDRYFSGPGSADYITISARYCALDQWVDGSQFQQASSTQGDIKVRVYG
ncbi:MAG TPA: hypothetical protein VFR44_04300 [Actinomycetota bacterium]|nr:hypothetical protein [Actinomycetota bacterium]